MTQSIRPYDDEIDLRKFVQVVLARWYWIAATTVLSAAVVLGVSLLQPKQYQASAYVVLTKPDVVFRFDPRITTEVEVPIGIGILDLVKSDDVILEILDSEEVANLEPDERYVDKLQERMDASLADTVFKLTIEDNDPELAAALINTWTQAVSNRINDIYVPSSRAQAVFAAHAEDAQKTWIEAQQAVAEFQETNPALIMQHQLDVKSSALSTYLATQHSLEIVLSDVEAMQLRLDSRDVGARADLRDDITTLLLTTRSLSSTAPLPIQLQILPQGDTMFNETVQEQILYLEELARVIDTQMAALEGQAAGLENEIYELQGQIAQAVETKARLEKKKSLAREAYEALARKAQETQLSAQEQKLVARVASRAAIPTEHVGRGVVIKSALGGAFGLMLGMALVLSVEWWRENPILTGGN